MADRSTRVRRSSRLLPLLCAVGTAIFAAAPISADPGPSGVPVSIAGGVDEPAAFHELDKQVILGAFDDCFDPGFIYPCCRCNDGIWPLTEYWWPVSKVENVDVPHKTGYLDKSEVARMKAGVEDVYSVDTSRDWLRNVAPRNVLLTRRSSQSSSLDAVRATATPLAAPSVRAKVDPFAREDGVNYNEYHAFTEPFGRAIDGMYWSRTMYGRLACHWNLPELPAARSYLSEAPIGFETSRRAESHNMVLSGKDNLRPGVGYDQDGLYKAGGWISEYVALSTSEKMGCMQIALDDSAPGESDSARDRCLRKNPGGWVPTSNRVKSPSPALASSVGTLRGIKLAYYYFPPDSFCKGEGMLDSAGYCYNPLIHGGNFYDFEPSPYAVAYAEHLANEIPGLSRLKGEDRLVADKVLWTRSSGMPKECMSLMRSFNAAASAMESEDGRHNVAVEWRFFRTCPKEVFGSEKSYGVIAGTNTAVCCERCECPGECCCPADKRL